MERTLCENGTIADNEQPTPHAGALSALIPGTFVCLDVGMGTMVSLRKAIRLLSAYQSKQ